MVATTSAKTCLKVSATAGGAGSYTSVGQVNSLGVTESTKNVDLTVMGVSVANAWTKSSTCMLRSATYTGSGFFDYYDDTTGQDLIMDNANNGAICWFKYWYGTGAGAAAEYVKSQVMVTDFTIKTSTQTMVEFSFTAESTGIISRGTESII